MDQMVSQRSPKIPPFAHIVSTGKEMDGRTNIVFIIRDKRYRYWLDAWRISQCEYIAKRSILKALNYAKKHGELYEK